MKVNRTVPPPAIGSARVLAYATVDKTVEYTGRQRLFVGGALLQAVPCIAICRPMGKQAGEFLVFYCDRKWNELGVVAASSMASARKEVERNYSGICKRLVALKNSERSVRRWLAITYPRDVCSFCRKMSFEVDAMIEGDGVQVCSACVEDFAMQLKARND
jgi:hypothetical protein